MAEWIKLRQFSTGEEFEEESVRLLAAAMCESSEDGHAVMLTGGGTPLPIYNRIAADPFTITNNLYVLFSDDRLVPIDSVDSNIGNAGKMLKALGLAGDHVLKVRGELPLAEAASRYDRDIQALLGSGVRLRLGILGLGVDGHVASMFSPDDVERGMGVRAIAVERESGLDRVSVTCDVLAKVERIVFLVSGNDKVEIARQLVESPASMPAGLALTGHPDVELWYSQENYS